MEAACETLCGLVNARVHWVTRRAPLDMLVKEQARLHRLPERPHTVGVRADPHGRDDDADGGFEGGQYSVPHTLHGKTLLARACGCAATASAPPSR